MSRVNYRLKLLEIAAAVEAQIPPPPTDKGARLDVVRAAKIEVIKGTAAELEEWVLRDVKSEDMAAEKSGQNGTEITVTDGTERSYSHKEELKNLGFHWDKEKKAWIGNFPNDDIIDIMSSPALKGLTVTTQKV